MLTVPEDDGDEDPSEQAYPSLQSQPGPHYGPAQGSPRTLPVGSDDLAQTPTSDVAPEEDLMLSDHASATLQMRPAPDSELARGSPSPPLIISGVLALTPAVGNALEEECEDDPSEQANPLQSQPTLQYDSARGSPSPPPVMNGVLAQTSAVGGTLGNNIEDEDASTTPGSADVPRTGLETGAAATGQLASLPCLRW